MDKYIKTFIFFLSLTLNACGQNSSGLDNQDEKRAREILKKSLTDTTLHNVIASNNIILKDKEQAIKFAEEILFGIYGKKEITNQRPYKVYNIDNFWVISGTLPQDKIGGTFLIIIDSRDCRIIRVTHGK